MESWNGANAVIHYGRGGEFTTDRRDEQEMGAIALHILQAALADIDTLMIQDVLSDPAWSGALTEKGPPRAHPAVLDPHVALRSLPARDGPTTRQRRPSTRPRPNWWLSRPRLDGTS